MIIILLSRNGSHVLCKVASVSTKVSPFVVVLNAHCSNVDAASTENGGVPRAGPWRRCRLPVRRLRWLRCGLLQLPVRPQPSPCERAGCVSA